MNRRLTTDTSNGPRSQTQFRDNTQTQQTGFLDGQQAAKVIGITRIAISILTSRKILPLAGKRKSKHGRALYSAVVVYECAADTAWLAKAYNALAEHWRVKNARRTKNADFETGE